MDLSKAFDTVPHKRLLEKLRFLLIPNSPRHMENFLCYQKQRVTVNGQASEFVNIMSQWNSTGHSILVLIYMNNLPDNLESPVRLYVDDCILYQLSTTHFHRRHSHSTA